MNKDDRAAYLKKSFLPLIYMLEFWSYESVLIGHGPTNIVVVFKSYSDKVTFLDFINQKYIA